MNIIAFPDKNQWPALLARPVQDAQDIEAKVSPILKQVKDQGDAGIKELALRFDKTSLTNIAFSESELAGAADLLDQNLKDSIGQAYNNIYRFHEKQIQSPEKVETMPGVTCWRKSVGIEKVGIYIPGGSAPLFSTVLMLGIPAKIAGCKEIIYARLLTIR